MGEKGSVSVKWDEEFQIVISRGRQNVVVEHPPASDHDHDEEVGPIDLFISGLGACVMSVVAHFLHRREIPFNELRAEITWEYFEDPYRVGAIDVQLKLPETLDKKMCTALEKVARACTVHNTLTHPPKIDVGVDACLAFSEKD